MLGPGAELPEADAPRVALPRVVADGRRRIDGRRAARPPAAARDLPRRRRDLARGGRRPAARLRGRGRRGRPRPDALRGAQPALRLAQRRRLLALARRSSCRTSSPSPGSTERTQRRNSPRATITAEPPTSIRSTRVGAAVDARVQRRRPADLGALRDLDLVAERDPPVPREVERERAGRRAGGRILGDAEPGANMRVFQRGPAPAKQLMPSPAERRRAAAGRAASAADLRRPSRARRRRAGCRCRRARPAAATRRRAPPELGGRARTARTVGSGCSIRPKTIRAPSRSSATGTVPRPVSIRISSSCSGPASTNAVPSVGCPANGTSSAGVKMRILTWPSACGRDRRTSSPRSSSPWRAAAASPRGSRARR